METTLLHKPCWYCRDGGHHPCDYGDDGGDCWRKGAPMVVIIPEHGEDVVFYCREHAAIMVPILESDDDE